MINDLPEHLEMVKGIKTALYADDSKMTSSPYKQHQKLNGRINEALQKLSEWCRNNNMAINTTKTNYQIFTLAHKIPHFSIQINEDKISETNV